MLLGRGFVAASSATYDEPVHLASGYHALTGRPLNWRDHPPLAEAWDALPLLALRPTAMRGLIGTHKLYDLADLFLYKNTVDAARMLGAARLWSLATWGALWLGVVAAWAYALGGLPAAAGACALAAFFPPLVSNAALVTTDAAPAALYALACLLLARPARGWKSWAGAGAALGLALASKFSMIAAPGVALAALLTETRLKDAPRAPAGRVALMIACFAAAIWLVYARWGLDLFVEGLRGTLTRLDAGRSAYLFGRHSTTGWLWYFPAALALKTPAPTLLLWLGALACWLRAPDRARFWAAFPALAFLAAACFSKTQIGYRHVLPVYPFMLVAAGWALSALWTRAAWGKALAALLVAWQAASVLRAQPFQLAYFSELAGGPSRGHLMLADSNLDWGQDLPALAAELKRRGDPAVYLSYFGVADPAYHGIRYAPVAWITNVERRDGAAAPPKDGPVLLAVSATNLHSVYYPIKDVWSWLLTRTPVFTAGHSIFLYDLTQDQDGRARLSALLQLLHGTSAR